MTLEDYKKKNGQSIDKNKYFKNLITRIFLSIIFALIVLIISNFSSKSQNFIEKHLFETDFNFSSINKLYNRYFLDLNKTEEDTPVASIENLSYKSSEKYKDGVKLEVETNYPVKLLQSGIIVFIGNKEGYGNTIIVQQSNGTDAWYANITNENVKLYDYVEKGTILGNADKTLYLVFQKEGAFLDYNEFIK